MAEVSLTIAARDGYPLAATLFRPPVRASQVVLLTGAMGVPRTFYDHFARYLAANACAVLTFDYRGIGGSRPDSLRGFDASLRDWGERDIAGAIDWLCTECGETSLSVVSHSVGGQILGLAENVGRVQRLVAVAVQSGYWRHWDFPRRLQIAWLWYVGIPVVTPLLGFFPSRLVGLGRSLPRDVAREWARWGRDPDYLHGRFAPATVRHFSEFTGRILAYCFSDDPIAPRRAVEAYLPRYGNARLEVRHVWPSDLGVDEIGHFGYFKDRFHDSLWCDSLAWLKERRTGD